MPSCRAASMRFVPGATSISFPSMVSLGMPRPACSPSLGRSESRPSSFPNQRLELVAEFLDVGDVRPNGAIVEGTDRSASAALGDIEDRVEILLAAVAGQDALTHLVDPARGFPTR